MIKCRACGLYCDDPSEYCSTCRPKPYTRSEFCKCDKNFNGEMHRSDCPEAFGHPEREHNLQRYDAFVRATMEVIPRFGIPMPDGERPYLERLILEVKPDGSKTYLHVIYGSDGDRDPHCHPFHFQSTIIHGSYLEQVYIRHCATCDRSYTGDVLACECGAALGCIEDGGQQLYRAGEQNHKKAHQLHRLTLTAPVVTLVRRGPKIREWGFATPEGWVHHAPYIAEKFPGAQPTEVD